MASLPSRSSQGICPGILPESTQLTHWLRIVVSTARAVEIEIHIHASCLTSYGMCNALVSGLRAGHGVVYITPSLSESGGIAKMKNVH